MKKLILFLCVWFFMVGGTPAFAINIDIWEVTDNNTTKINNWIGAQAGSTHVLEDFEGIDTGWYTKKDTGVGTFTAEGSIGEGATSYKDSDRPYFSVQNHESHWYGRSNTTTSEGASQWLDSGDITRLTLTLKNKSLTNLFFYMQDPADVPGTETELSIMTEKNYIVYTTRCTFFDKKDKASFFVGISLTDDEEVLSKLSWLTNSQNDGFGLDDFSTIHNPEPATMLLFGFGLIGIAGISRRMI